MTSLPQAEPVRLWYNVSEPGTPISDEKTTEILICGQPYSVHAYDWYVCFALDVLAKFCPLNQVRHKSITYDFVVSFRHAIREARSYRIIFHDGEFTSINQIKAYIKAINGIHNYRMRY